MNARKIEELLTLRQSVKYTTPFGFYYKSLTSTYLKMHENEYFNQEMNEKVEEFWENESPDVKERCVELSNRAKDEWKSKIDDLDKQIKDLQGNDLAPKEPNAVLTLKLDASNALEPFFWFVIDRLKNSIRKNKSEWKTNDGLDFFRICRLEFKTLDETQKIVFENEAAEERKRYFMSSKFDQESNV